MVGVRIDGANPLQGPRRRDDEKPTGADVHATVRTRDRQRGQLLDLARRRHERRERGIEPLPPGRGPVDTDEPIGKGRKPYRYDSEPFEHDERAGRREVGVHEVGEEISKDVSQFVGEADEHRRTRWHEVGAVGCGQPWRVAHLVDDGLGEPRVVESRDPMRRG